MIPKERVMAVIDGRRPGRIPVHHLQFSGDTASVILGREAYVGGAYRQWREIQALWKGEEAHREFKRQSEEDAVALAKACGHDILRLGYWSWPSSQKPVRRIDEYTFLFGNPGARWYEMTYNPDVELLTRRDGYGSRVMSLAETLEPEEEITEETLLQEVLREEARTQSYQPRTEPAASTAAAIEKYPEYLLKLGGYTVGIDITSERELVAMAQWPELWARKLMARAQRAALDIPRMAAAGMQVNFAGADFCTNDGPIISPGLFRDVVIPALRLVVDACHSCGIRYFYSSDGNFWPVADDMFNGAGVDGWFEVDKSAGMDLRRLRERFPRVTLIGNIRSQVLHRGTVEDVRRETMECLEVAHDLGGIVVGVSNMIMPGTPPKNIMTMLEVIERER